MSTERITLHTYVQSADVPYAAWARLLRPEDLYLDEHWLRVAERTAGCPMRYALLHRGGVPVAGLATALADKRAPWVLARPDTLLEFSAKDGRPGAGELLEALPGTPADALLPTLVCGGRHMGRSRVVARPEVTHPDVEALVAWAEELAVEQGAASVAYPFVEESDKVLRQVLRERGYLSHESGRYSMLSVPPGGFDDYLLQVSAHRRSRILTERRRISEAGIRMRIELLRAELIPRLGELEYQLMEKYGVAWSPEQTGQVLGEMLAEFGEDVRVVLAEGDGEVRGFATILQFRGHWYARQSGFDYAYQDKLGKLPLYFETVYYFPVEEAARLGISTIHYGLGSEGAKLSRGCTAEPQYSYLLPVGPLGKTLRG
ncbi:GNAT family N-acetyltransferase [Streptomyces sp. NBC_00210]|uniref:GNAT family N-acetyltransferase n=1 Tax=unclassified Streptomyces TaxID=2593676 RepID=UPI003251D998